MNQANFTGYIGTYTKGESEGIYSFKLDSKSGKIGAIKPVAKLENPTYVNLSDDERFLFSVAKEGEQGGVASFSVNHETGELTKINQQLSEGAVPCHVSVDRKNQTVLTANYHKGTVEAYTVNAETGVINQDCAVARHEGSGPDPRQEKAHTHFAGFTPDENYLVVVELGIDQILTYKLSGGELIKVSSLAVKPGSGPRHLAFHPNQRMAYVMTEFSSEVLVLEYDANSGQFTQRQAISTLPADFTENNQGSAIHVTSDGKFLYAGNRGHNSIAVFAIDEESNLLSLIEFVGTEGDWPRDFALDPSEQFIVAANQESNNLTVFSRDSISGKLSLLEANIKVPSPVCVKFKRS
ncbi:lactonase family protein [Bacillus sp. DNRA2]|uniref:lactonase family protein n=1 Tax=Bacillus sp. DNRA2 TaxID=2723053 RepID=UPI00145CC02E|nr:lactonase family protein [Bacillus sp. DNRA2]NMD68956.1 lactonase family protein [Bacillus sp. DNRA2]